MVDSLIKLWIVVGLSLSLVKTKTLTFTGKKAPPLSSEFTLPIPHVFSVRRSRRRWKVVKPKLNRRAPMKGIYIYISPFNHSHTWRMNLRFIWFVFSDWKREERKLERKQPRILTSLRGLQAPSSSSCKSLSID